MGALFAEGFDNNLGSSNVELGKIFEKVGTGANTALIVTGGRFGGGRMKLISGAVAQKLIDIDGSLNLTELYVGFVLSTSQWRDFDYAFLQNIEEVAHIRVHISVSGVVSLKDAAGNIVGSGPTPMSLLDWHYVEFRWKLIDGINDIGQLQIDKALGDTSFDIDVTGNFSAAGTPTCRYAQWSSTGNETTFDDMQVLDTNGTPNDFLGDGRIYTLRPTADVTPNEWNATPGPNHFEAVNEADGSGGEADFLNSAIVDDEERFEYDDIPVTGDQINFVFQSTRANKSDAGAAFIKQVVVSNAVEEVGPSQSLLSTSRYHNHYVELDPNTGLPWTLAGVNALTGGFKVA